MAGGVQAAVCEVPRPQRLLGDLMGLEVAAGIAQTVWRAALGRAIVDHIALSAIHLPPAARLRKGHLRLGDGRGIAGRLTAEVVRVGLHLEDIDQSKTLRDHSRIPAVVPATVEVAVVEGVDERRTVPDEFGAGCMLVPHRALRGFVVGADTAPMVDPLLEV